MQMERVVAARRKQARAAEKATRARKRGMRSDEIEVHSMVGVVPESDGLARARDLVTFARRHGYDRDELIKIIESLG